MAEQLRQKSEAFQLAVVFIVVSFVISIVLEFSDPASLTVIVFRAVVGALGITAAWAVYMHRPKTAPSREDLILDMGCIKSFPVPSTIRLVEQYRCADLENRTREEDRELAVVDMAQQYELRRYDHQAFKDDHTALRAAYNAGEFHKALRYASMKWLVAILLVAKSRGDLNANRVLAEHFGQ